MVALVAMKLAAYPDSVLSRDVLDKMGCFSDRTLENKPKPHRESSVRVGFETDKDSKPSRPIALVLSPLESGIVRFELLLEALPWLV